MCQSCWFHAIRFLNFSRDNKNLVKPEKTSCYLVYIKNNCKSEVLVMCSSFFEVQNYILHKIPGVQRKQMFSKEFSRAMEENYKIPGVFGEFQEQFKPC